MPILDGKGTPPRDLAASMFTPSFDARRERVDGIAATDPRANARGDLAAPVETTPLPPRKSNQQPRIDGWRGEPMTRRARDV